MHGGDDAIMVEKTEDELETASSDESENRSEIAESVRMFDSDRPDQPRAKRRRNTTGEAPTPQQQGSCEGPCEQTSRPEGSKRAESNRSRSASKAWS